MNSKRFLGLVALAAASSLAGFTAQAGTLGIQYFDVANTGPAGDFGVCCGPPASTQEVVALGSALGPDGLPVATLGSVNDQNGTGEILWWSTASTSPVVNSTGSGTFTLGPLTNMFAPNNTGPDNSSFFETAILSGTLTGTGADAKITIISDDDALVYLNGLYVGGNPGVHPDETAVIDLGHLTGSNSLEIFYADRARVGADLSVNIAGASVPEPAAWALMLVGFGGLGAALRGRRLLTAA
ncbi:MAG TPA: PEPxxWA-CTERM sorting domain-containing protein [Caulobacteraceae bacterium]